MKKVLIAPDSFKGTLSATQVADTIAAVVAERFPDCIIEKLPMADGGEGSVEAIIAAVGGCIEYAHVQSPDNKSIPAHFGVTTDNTAVLEVAQSTGITRQIGLHPMTSNTYGFGQLILCALDLGLRDFFLCLGGSASTDAGCGMAAALGVQFLDSAEQPFVPSGATLHEIAGIDTSRIDSRIKDSTFTVMCDVDNPLYGKSGAAWVYAPQKGAGLAEVQVLDQGLCHVSELYRQTFGIDYAGIPGSGAAGGLGFGCMTLLEASLVSGIDAILNLCDFQGRLIDVELIITGEGKIDRQSFCGKVLSGILRSAEGIPVLSICGVNDAEEHLLHNHGLAVFEISENGSLEESLRNPKDCLKRSTIKALETLTLKERN